VVCTTETASLPPITKAMTMPFIKKVLEVKVRCLWCSNCPRGAQRDNLKQRRKKETTIDTPLTKNNEKRR
jgi:hypothetical protein